MEADRVFTRLAGREDLEAVFSFIREIAVFAGADPASVEATPEKLRRALFSEPPLGEVLLAEVDGVAVGFASFHQTFSTFLAQPCLWLDDLFVRPEQRGQGAGTALMRHLARIARERGCGRIDWIVNTSNGRGISFYVKSGAAVRPHVNLWRVDRKAIERLAAS